MSISEEAVVKCDCKVDDGGSSGDSRGDSGIDLVMEDDKKEVTLLRGYSGKSSFPQ
jgi:hypothetical protein